MTTTAATRRDAWEQAVGSEGGNVVEKRMDDEILLFKRGISIRGRDSFSRNISLDG